MNSLPTDISQLTLPESGAAIVAVFLIAHLVIGALTGKRASVRPMLRTLFENAGADIDRRLNRDMRTVSDLMMRGIVTVLVISAFAWLIGYAAHRFSNHAYGWAVELLFISTCVSVMGPVALMRRVHEALEKDDLKSARSQLQAHVPEDISTADTHGVVRKTLELSADRMNQYFIAPLFYLMLLQSTGMALYAAFMSLHHAFGSDNPRHQVFGDPIRGLEKILNYIPARITALVIVFGALFVSKSNPLRGFATALEQARKYKAINRGWLVAAEAGALGVTLGGPVRHGDKTVEHGWIGPKSATAKGTPADLKRGILLHFVVYLCVLAAILSLAATGF